MRHVIFRLDKDRYALPLAAIREVVVPPERYTRVPRAPDVVSGVMNLRGRVVTVVELRGLLGLTSASASPAPGATPSAVTAAAGQQQSVGAGGTVSTPAGQQPGVGAAATVSAPAGQPGVSSAVTQTGGTVEAAAAPAANGSSGASPASGTSTAAGAPATTPPPAASSAAAPLDPRQRTDRVVLLDRGRRDLGLLVSDVDGIDSIEKVTAAPGKSSAAVRGVARLRGWAVTVLDPDGVDGLVVQSFGGVSTPALRG